MKHYLRLPMGLIGLMVLCLTQLWGAAHAGIGGATFRVNLSVTTAPTPAVQPTVSGSFTYGITCTAPSGPVFTFTSPALTIPINAATPTTAVADVTRGSFVSTPNECTVVQLARPAPPSGYLWNSAPSDVVLSNVVLTDPTTIYASAFANVLMSLPIVTAVAAPLAGGTVTCTQPTALSATSTCNAAANSGFTFNSFITSSCGSQSSTRPFITAPLSADCTVTAAFTPDPFVVTAVASPPAGGTISCSTPITFGNSSNCTATANSGYAFTGISTSSCGSPSVSSPFSTAALTSNCTVTATFTPTFVVTAVANPAIGGTINCTSPAISGATSSCSVATNPGYVLSGVSGCGGATTAPGTFVTAPIAAACSVTAVFAPFAITPSVPVPTLSGWMLILLTLLVVGMGGAICARRLS